jgi:hypothetical protein
LDFTEEGADFDTIGVYTSNGSASYCGTFDGNGKSITLAQAQGGVFEQLGAGAVIKDLTVKGSIETAQVGAIGAVANEAKDAVIEGCVNEADVTVTGTSGIRILGGIVGQVTSTDATKTNTGGVFACENKGAITGVRGHIGGVIGEAGSFTSATFAIHISDCINSGTVLSTASAQTEGVGGIVGSTGGNTASKAVEVTRCLNTGSVSGVSAAVGGIVGVASGPVSNCENTGAITGTGKGGVNYGIGGIAGTVRHEAKIERVINRGPINSTADSGAYAGGIIGSLHGQHAYQNMPSLSHALNFATVSAPWAGGIIGAAPGGPLVSNCYNGGAVVSTSEGAAGIVGAVTPFLEAGREDTGTPNRVLIENCYNTGDVSSDVAEGSEAVPVLAPVLAEFRTGTDDVPPNPTRIRQNYYALASVPEGTSVTWGDVVVSSNGMTVSYLLEDILSGVGIDEEVKWQDSPSAPNPWPVPESLWVDTGTGEPGEQTPRSVQYTFNVVPLDATVVLTDSEGVALEPVEGEELSYALTQGSNYTYTISADGYVTKSETFRALMTQTLTIGLIRTDVGEYLPGWGKWRPVFSVYMLNRDGTTGTLIDSWDFDVAQGTYVDEDGTEAPIVTDFSDAPLYYSGIDRMPAARLGIVTRGITYPDLIAHYNQNNGTLADITGDNYESFTMKASTNSTTNEDPCASSSPTHPGTWALPGAFDTFTGTQRYFYPEWLYGNPAGTGAGLSTKDLGEGIAVKSTLSVAGYNTRIIDMPATIIGENRYIDTEREFNNAKSYLASVADSERAVRNFESMLPEVFSLPDNASGSLPLGADGSYHIGSIWIAPTYYPITTTVSGGSAEVILTGKVDALSAAEGETVRFTLDGVELEDEGIEGGSGAGGSTGEDTAPVPVTVKVAGKTLVPDDTGIYSFTMGDAAAEISITVGQTGPKVGLPASGDLDGDGHATASEALQVARAVISGTSGWSAEKIAAADMDGDGYLTMADVVRILRKAAGLT